MATKTTMSTTGNGWSRPPMGQLRVLKRGDDINPLLFDLLSNPTPHGEERRVADLLPPGNKGMIKTVDAEGNVFFTIGKPKQHKTMFSCHMDTVHVKSDKQIYLTATDDGYVYGAQLTKDDPDKDKRLYAPSVLGADDKVGMYIMLRMMRAKIPGVYAFHVGEEGGGIGSAFAVKSRFVENLTRNIERCIAFDRKGYNNIITHQRGDRCCSAEFATALANMLNTNEHTPMHMRTWFADSTGSFTDSANYADLVAECTNLSVGYFNQHGTTEHFDLIWLEQIFIPTLMEVEWDKLPTVRSKATSEKGEGFGSLCVSHNREKYEKHQRDQREKERQKYQSNYGGGTYQRGKNWYSNPSNISKHTAWSNIPDVSAKELIELYEDILPPQDEGIAICLAKTMAMLGAEEMALIMINVLNSYRALHRDYAQYKKDNNGTSNVDVDKLKWMADMSQNMAQAAHEEVEQHLRTINRLRHELMAERKTTAVLKGTVDGQKARIDTLSQQLSGKNVVMLTHGKHEGK